MRRILSAVMVIFLVLSCASCKKGPLIENEDQALHVYTCSKKNIMGLEKVAIFDDYIVLVIDKKTFDSIDEKDFPGYELGHDPEIVFETDGSYYTYCKKKTKIKQNKMLVTVSFEIPEERIIPGKPVIIHEVSVMDFTISLEDGITSIYYEKLISDAWAHYIQKYDASSDSWGEVDTEFISAWSGDLVSN